MVRKLLIVFTVVLALILVSLFLPAREMSIEGIGKLSIGQEAAYAMPDIKVSDTFTETDGGIGVDVDAVSTGTGTGSPITVSHPTSGTNRLMLVGISAYGSSLPVVSGVTYNGVALSLVGSQQQGNYTKIWVYKLVAPDTGTHDAVVSFSTAPTEGCVVGVETFTGVDQTTPLGTFASASAGSGDTATVDVSSATGELVFDTLWTYSECTATVGAGQTQRWNTTSSHTVGAGSTEPGASTVTMSWTLSSSIYWWIIGAVPIKPVSPHVDTVSTGTGDGSSITISHTTSGTNRLMLVGISGSYSSGSPVISGVTYNGDALSLVGSQAYSNWKVWIYKLVAPDTGTHDAVVSFSTAPDQGCVVGVETFTGVDQTTPLGTFAGANGNSATATVDVSSATGELVFDTLWFYTTYTATAGAGQTQQWQTSSYMTKGSGSIEPGASTVTMSWSISGSFYWAIGAVPIKPATSAIALTSHIPDIGVGWTEVYDDSTAGTDAQVIAATDHLQAGSDENNKTQMYTAQPNPTGVNQDISITNLAGEDQDGSKGWGIFGRRTDNNNYYVVQIMPNGEAASSVKLFKRVSGVLTELGAYDATLANGTVIKLEIRNAAKKVYVNGVERISSADNALTSAGTWGIVFGGNATYAGTDSVHLRDNWHVDNFLAEEPAEVVSISVSPETKNWGTVNPGQIYSSATEEFTVTNTGNVTVNTSIQGEDATASGAPNWVLSDTASPGSDRYGLKFSFNLSSWVIIQKSTPVSFKAALGVGASDTFGLQLLTPTYISTPNKTYSAKIYITAVKA